METRYTVVHGFQKLALMFSLQEEEGGTDTYIHYFFAMWGSQKTKETMFTSI